MNRKEAIEGSLAHVLNAPLSSATNFIPIFFMSPNEETCVLFIFCHFPPTTPSHHPLTLHIFLLITLSVLLFPFCCFLSTTILPYIPYLGNCNNYDTITLLKMVSSVHQCHTSLATSDF